MTPEEQLNHELTSLVYQQRDMITRCLDIITILKEVIERGKEEKKAQS